ncbi:MAG: GNAT family N-acetyltransferase [Methanomicrobiaceae archaeon]|nr:GNAT family N-acetyltransferase [Methanomicrobiaceae archaeon]
MKNSEVYIREYRDSYFSTVLEMESSRGGDQYCHAVFIRQMAVLFPGMFLIAQNAGGEIVGYVLGGLSADEPKSGLVMRIFVSKSCRRSGTGRLLMNELIKKFLDYGVKSMVLTVSPANEAALNMYEGLGFFKSGYISDYFGKGEDRIVMTALLDEKFLQNRD